MSGQATIEFVLPRQGVSLVILAFLYKPVQRSVLRLDDYLVASNRRLALFVGTLFLAPIALLATGFFYATS